MALGLESWEVGMSSTISSNSLSTSRLGAWLDLERGRMEGRREGGGKEGVGREGGSGGGKEARRRGGREGGRRIKC